MICLRLPFPPSVNDWLKPTIIHGKPRLFKAKAHKDWTAQAGMAYVEQRLTRGSPIKGWFSATLIMSDTKRGKIDLDNTLKCCMDFLQHVKMIDNDRFTEELHVRWGKTDRDGCVIQIVALPTAEARAA